MKQFGEFMVAIIIMLAAGLIRGFVVYKACVWIIEPISHFHLLYWQIVAGLYFLMVLRGYKEERKEKNEEKNQIQRIFETFCASVAYDFFGLLLLYIATLFI